MIDNQYSEIKHNKTAYQPSLNGGYSALYENRIPVDLKYIDYERNVNHLGREQFVIIRIFTYGNKVNAAKVKVQIDSEYDPFFNLHFQCDAPKYQFIQSQQSLSSDFQDFPTLLIKSFNKIEQALSKESEENSKGKFTANLLVGSDGKAKFTLNQSAQYKNIQIVTLDFSPENEENVEQKISFKYGQLKKKVEQSEDRLKKIEQLIRLKNPTLLTQIIKSTKSTHQSLTN